MILKVIINLNSGSDCVLISVLVVDFNDKNYMLISESDQFREPENKKGVQFFQFRKLFSILQFLTRVM